MRWAFQVGVVRVGVSPHRSSLLRHRMLRRAKHGRQAGRWTGDRRGTGGGLWLERQARGTPQMLSTSCPSPGDAVATKTGDRNLHPAESPDAF